MATQNELNVRKASLMTKTCGSMHGNAGIRRKTHLFERICMGKRDVACDAKIFNCPKQPHAFTRAQSGEMHEKGG